MMIQWRRFPRSDRPSRENICGVKLARPGFFVICTGTRTSNTSAKHWVGGRRKLGRFVEKDLFLHLAPGTNGCGVSEFPAESEEVSSELRSLLKRRSRCTSQQRRHEARRLPIFLDTSPRTTAGMHCKVLSAMGGSLFMPDIVRSTRWAVMDARARLSTKLPIVFPTMTHQVHRVVRHLCLRLLSSVSSTGPLPAVEETLMSYLRSVFFQTPKLLITWQVS